MQNSLEKTPNSADSAPSGETPTQPVETVICKRCGRINALGVDGCVQCRSTVKGGQLARKHPRVTTDDPLTRQWMRERADAIIVDRGGRENLSTLQIAAIEQFPKLERLLDSWEQYFVAQGVFTRQGRVRSGYREGYLSTLDRYLKLAALIGFERRAKAVPTLEEFLNGHAEEGEGHDENGSD